jgi:hypothetical protein
MSMSCTTDQLCAATSAARQTRDTPDVALVRSIAAGDKHFMPSEMGLCQFFHGFQPKFHSRTNDFPRAPVDDSVEQKTFVDIGRAEMTIAVADKTATAAPYFASLPRSARPVAHTVLSAAGAELARIWRTLKKDLCDPYRPELHYMRGPGPKWREKHANASLPRNALALSLILIPVADDASLSPTSAVKSRRSQLLIRGQ